MWGCISFPTHTPEGSSHSGNLASLFLYPENVYLSFTPSFNTTSSRKPAWTLPNAINYSPVLCFYTLCTSGRHSSWSSLTGLWA